MFFLRMITRSFTRQLRRRLLIALTVCLSATVSVSMLGVVFDVGDKLNAELSTYGSNITVQPKADAVVSDLYNTESGGATSTSDPTAFLKESDAAKIKTIFWSFNITSFAPQLNIHATVNGTNVPVVGTWFNKNLKISTGEIGKTLASELGVTTGDTITLNKTTASGKKNEQKIKLTGVYDSGDEDNGSLYIASSTAQVLADLPDSVDKIEVKALTTPENDLARKAAANPAALSQEEWETWYCTAYPSSIAYQIEEVIPGAVAKQVRQVAALQGNVLQKTQAVMILMTVLSLIAAAVAVANLMVASIGERSGELALLKALGATDAAVSRLMLAETAAISLLGAIVGALLGSGVAQLIGRVVFGSGITMRPMVFVLVFVLLAVTVLLASASSIRSILNLKPAEVLHGR